MTAETPHLPELSNAARELLIEAAEDRIGCIKRTTTQQGDKVSTNGREFIQPSDTKSSARWRGAVDELTRLGLIEDRSHDRKMLFVTDEGYRAADLLKSS
jgi:hypothetical protein